MANEERAKILYDNILHEVKSANFDSFARYNSEDSFVDDCIKKQSNSLNVSYSTRLLPQQTIVKSHEHYLQKTSTYWRKWKYDNDVLEFISENTIKNIPQKKLRPKLRNVPNKNVKTHKFSKACEIIPPKYDPIGPTNVKSLMLSTNIGLPSKAQSNFFDNNHQSSKFGYGVMSSTAPSRTKLKPLNSTSEPSFDADKYLRHNIGHEFSRSLRFEKPKINNPSVNNPPMATNELNSMPNIPGGEFSTAAREISGSNSSKQEDLPGPGAYHIPSFIDDSKRNNRGAHFLSKRFDPADLKNQTPKTKKRNNYKCLSQAEFAKEIVFGFGCSRDEHVMYGMCLDGMCGKRAHFERLMVEIQDNPRIIGDRIEAERIELVTELNSLKTTFKQAKDFNEQDLFNAKLASYENAASLTPLHIAAQRGDLETILKLSKMEIDVNAKESKFGWTALHFAVIRNNHDTVHYITELFKSTLNINCPDNNNDSPLHIACRSGLDYIIEILCDAGAAPLCYKNSIGKTPLDLAKNHKTYQLLQLTAEKIRKKEELEKLIHDCQNII